jgi:hypothetical protein
MAWPKTRWAQVTLFAWIFAIGYVLAIVLTALKGREWYDWVRDVTSAGFGVALMIISIWYGGVLTNFYDKLTGFGISEVRVDRHGADPMLTKLWLDRIQGSENVTIVGTLSQGWFVVAKGPLKDLLRTSKHPKSVRVCLLDPFGKVWRSRIESGQSTHNRFLRDATQVFTNLCDLLADTQANPNGRIVIQLYDTDPLSCVVARGAIYLGLYLPRTQRKEIPEFTISGGSFLGDKVVAESVKKLQDSAPCVDTDGLRKYIAIMEKHFTTSREAFWGDPSVFCDFCKEYRSLPSEFSRRFPSFGEGSRIVPAKEYFFLVPSLGQMLEDHALIVTEKHITASAQLEAQAFSTLTDIFDRLRKKAEAAEKSQLFFEHGIPFEGSEYGGCGICHCHIHSITVEIPDYKPFESLEAFLKKKNCQFQKQTLTSWSEVRNFAKASYLCVQVGTSEPVLFTFEVGQRIESQLMRQFLAENCPKAKSEWDWRSEEDNPEVLQTTCNRLSEIFSESAVPASKA